MNPLLKYIPDEIVRESETICGQLFDRKCCKDLIHNFDISDEKCLKLYVVKLLGYGIIVLGSVVKLPQVLKIFGAKSGAGLSIFGVLLELLAITFNSCYSLRNNFPISAWGESIALAIETALIAYMILWYSGLKGRAMSFIVLYIGIVYSLTHPTLVPKEIMWWLQTSVLPLAVCGKLLQAFKNYKLQHTGQLSAVTAWAIFGGSVTRIITTIQETGDKLTAVTFICSSTANAIIALQVLWYWKSTEKFLAKAKAKKSD